MGQGHRVCPLATSMGRICTQSKFRTERQRQRQRERERETTYPSEQRCRGGHRRPADARRLADSSEETNPQSHVNFLWTLRVMLDMPQMLPMSQTNFASLASATPVITRSAPWRHTQLVAASHKAFSAWTNGAASMASISKWCHAQHHLRWSPPLSSSKI